LHPHRNQVGTAANKAKESLSIRTKISFFFARD
jgi:hypothetical protein